MSDFLMIAAGLVVLLIAGEALLKGAVSIANRMGLSKLLVGAVIIGFGTSMPEMTVSVGAALKNAPEIALGNVVGSNIANILLIIGVAAVLAPLYVNAMAVRRDMCVMIGASLLLCLLSAAGMLNAISGAAMVLMLVSYVAYGYHADRRAYAARPPADIGSDDDTAVKMHNAVAILLCLGGLAGLMGGAHLLVTGAVSLARGFGISEAVIGLTIVAVGTSLPELATALVASIRRQNDMVLGNILGSNIFNILCIIGVTCLVKPIVAVGQLVELDVWIMLGVVVFLSVFLWRGITIGRAAGAFMLALYTGYTLWLYLGVPAAPAL